MRKGGLLLALIWVLGARSMAAADPLVMNIRPIWDSYARAGIASELHVSLRADRGGEGSLRVVSSSGTVQVPVVLVAGVAQELVIPFLHSGSDALHVVARIGDMPGVEQDVGLQMLPPATRLAVEVSRGITSEIPGALVRKDIAFLQASLDTLPQSEQPYAALDALILDAEILRYLKPAQLQALRAYVGGCGALYLRDISPRVLVDLARYAGCSGASLHELGEIDATFSELSRNSWTGKRAAATLTRLATSEAGGSSHWRTIGLFLAGYFAVLVILAVSARRSGVLLVAPVCAVLLALLVWRQMSPSGDWVGWIEMDSGDQLARYTVLLRLEGGAIGAASIPMARSFGIPQRTLFDESVEVVMQGRQSHLNVQTRLMSPHGFVWQGTLSPSLVPTLTMSLAGPVVENSSTQPLAGAVLVWDGERYDVPRLAVAESWSPPAKPGRWENTVLEQVLRSRGMDSVAALLVPFDMQEASVAPAAGTGSWLLVRAASGDVKI